MSSILCFRVYLLLNTALSSLFSGFSLVAVLDVYASQPTRIPHIVPRVGNNELITYIQPFRFQCAFSYNEDHFYHQPEYIIMHMCILGYLGMDRGTRRP